MIQMVALQSLAMMSFKGNDSLIETEYTYEIRPNSATVYWLFFVRIIKITPIMGFIYERNKNDNFVF